MIDVVDGALLALGALVAVVVARFGVALLRHDGDLDESAAMTAESIAAVASAAFAVGAMGIVSATEILGGVFGFIGMHPFAASNGFLAGVGAVASFSGIAISPIEWIGLGIATMGVVLVIMDVRDGGLIDS